MKSLAVLLTSALALASSAVAALADIPQFTQEEIDTGVAIRELGRIAYENALARVEASTEGCTKENVRIRKEWYVLLPPLPVPSSHKGVLTKGIPGVT